MFSLASILDVSFNTVKLLAPLDEPLEREESHGASDRQMSSPRGEPVSSTLHLEAGHACLHCGAAQQSLSS